MYKKFVVLSFVVLVLASPAFSATPGYNRETGEIILPSEVSLYEAPPTQPQNDLADIQAAEAQYKALQEAAEETARIQLWEKMDREITLRRYDKLVFEMRKNFDEARAATNPFIGEQGYVIYPYGEVIPIITCRPMRMTDVALEPGESIMGIHAGDTVRWMFAPGPSMTSLPR